jgi:integrase
MKLPRHVIRRGDSLYVRLFEPASGKYRTKATGLKADAPGASQKAAAIRDALEAKLAAGCEIGGGLTVAHWTKQFFDRRTNWNKSNEEAAYRDHVAPTLGRMRIDEVRPHHVKAWVRALCAKGLAPKTAHNVYGVAFTLFAAAASDELITASPFNRRFDGLPKKRDKDPTFRDKAVFTRSEVERLLGSETVPLRSRAAYAVLFLGGLRAGELAHLRWSDYRTDLEPLGRLTVRGSFHTRKRVEKGTKQDTPRKVPVHRVAARLLAEWRLAWALEFGRHATDDDLIFPAAGGKRKGVGHWTNFRQRTSLLYWLGKLGMRPRRLHDTRRTFVSLATDDGATKDRLKWIKDGRERGGDSIEGYDEPSWQSLCDELGKLRITPRCNEQDAIPLRRIANSTHSADRSLQLSQDLPKNAARNGSDLPTLSMQLPDIAGEEWRAQSDSNRRPTGSKPGHGSTDPLLRQGPGSPYTYGVTQLVTSAEDAIRLGAPPLALLAPDCEEEVES